MIVFLSLADHHTWLATVRFSVCWSALFDDTLFLLILQTCSGSDHFRVEPYRKLSLPLVEKTANMRVSKVLASVLLGVAMVEAANSDRANKADTNGVQERQQDQNKDQQQKQ